MKSKLMSCTNGTFETLEQDKDLVENLAVEIVKIISEKNLNYRQAVAVLELAQAEIKECVLNY